MSSSAFNPSILSTVTSGGTGQLNVLSNSTGATGTIGWSGVTVVSGTSSPLNPVVTTAFSIANTAGAESATSGGYSTFTLPASLQNKKIKVEFYFTTPATDVYRLSVYKSGTRVPLSTDSSNVTTLPASTTGKFVAYFDTDTTSTWSVNITRTTGTTGPCYITNVVVGPDLQAQAGALQEWQSYTPTLTNLGNATTSFMYQRVGSSCKVKGTIIIGSSLPTGNIAFSLPSGINASYVKNPKGLINTDAYQRVGIFTGIVSSGAGRISGVIIRNNTSTTSFIAFSPNVVSSNLQTGFNDVSSQLSGISFASGDTINIDLEVEIAEWVSNGTVQLAQNDVEYSFNSSTSTTADDTSSFAYGPQGALIQSITAQLKRQVRFQTPIQVTDKITVEVSTDRTTWIPVGGLVGSGGVNIDSLRFDGTNNIGIGPWNPGTLASTDIHVFFGKYSTGTTTSWATPGAAYWRVKKEKAGAAVGFGIVQGTSSGLVPAYNTNFDDVTATRLGLKQYLHGTTYNGGIAPTVTCSQSGFSVTRALFITYQVQDGTWRLRFNIAAGYTLASVGSLTLTINGVTFKNISNFLQTAAVFVNSSGSANMASCYASNNSGNLQIQTTNVASSNTVVTSGDLELDSKPTWAY